MFPYNILWKNQNELFGQSKYDFALSSVWNTLYLIQLTKHFSVFGAQYYNVMSIMKSSPYLPLEE